MQLKQCAPEFNFYFLGVSYFDVNNDEAGFKPNKEILQQNKKIIVINENYKYTTISLFTF